MTYMTSDFHCPGLITVCFSKPEKGDGPYELADRCIFKFTAKIESPKLNNIMYKWYVLKFFRKMVT